MSRKKRIVIIGAGAIGLSSAYFLHKSGHDVTILDNSPKISNCSYGNAGMIVPSHFIPLAAPGVIWQGVKWLLNPESPFSIKPSINPQLISWLYRFYKSSTKQHVNSTMSQLYALNKTSRDLFVGINKEINFDLETRGLLILANTQKGFEHELVNLDLAKNLEQSAENVGVDEAKELLKLQDLNIAGAVYYKDDAHLSPAGFMNGLSNYLLNEGIITHKATEAFRFSINKTGIVGVNTNSGLIEGDEFVLATGAWSAELIRKLGIKLLVAPGKGYSFTIQNPDYQLGLPCILAEAKVAITPFKNSLRFAGTMEIGGFNLSVDKRRVSGMIKSINSYFPDYKNVNLEGSNVWAGLRPVSYDGLPFIGRFKKYPNLIAATGHSMMGISLAPVTGNIIENIVSNKKSNFNLDLLSPNRN